MEKKNQANDRETMLTWSVALKTTALRSKLVHSITKTFAWLLGPPLGAVFTMKFFNTTGISAAFISFWGENTSILLKWRQKMTKCHLTLYCSVRMNHFVYSVMTAVRSHSEVTVGGRLGKLFFWRVLFRNLLDSVRDQSCRVHSDLITPPQK